MNSFASMGDGWLASGSFLGLLQDSPFGDALGWIVVFFVIVWPILRGILATARTNREEHDSKQANAAPRSEKRERARRTLEEILEGKLEPIYDEEPAPAPPPRPRVKRPKQAASAPARLGERPTDEGAAPVYSADDLYSDSRDKKLGGDPFDESSMESDLVPEARLRHIPSEDEVETGTASSGTHARGTTKSSVAENAVGSAVAARRSGLPTSEPLLARDDPEVLFRRLKRPLSPWQKAVVLREVMSPPLATRPSPTLTDLPD